MTDLYGTVLSKISRGYGDNLALVSSEEVPQTQAQIAYIEKSLTVNHETVTIGFEFNPPLRASVTQPILDDMRSAIEELRDEDNPAWVKLATAYNAMLG